MIHLLFRPVVFVSLVLGLFVIAELFVIGNLTWRNHQRLERLAEDIKNGHQLEETIFIVLQNELDSSQSPARKSSINIDTALLTGHIDDSVIMADVKKLQQTFAQALNGNNSSLMQSLATTRQLFARQRGEEEQLLEKIDQDSQLELQLAIFLPLLTFVLIGLIGRYFFRRNVLLPLHSLKDFLLSLAHGDRQPIRQKVADPVMQAVFDHYNRLVLRLKELEEEHQEYTERLEKQVRQTSSALLEQSHQLARGERLSAVAELAASTAHELRNPLTGIQFALDNILLDCDSDDIQQRLQMVSQEIKRVTQHLNELLTLTRTSSHPPQPINLQAILQELRLFLQYQIPENIHLLYNVDSKLIVQLPETEFRLVLLNLLLNAVQSIGKQPGEVIVQARQESSEIVITIEDSGPGFCDELLQHGIRPFVSLKEQGTGLGLAMVQRFMKSQQGTVRLSNNEQGHACVTLVLPYMDDST